MNEINSCGKKPPVVWLGVGGGGGLRDSHGIHRHTEGMIKE